MAGSIKLFSLNRKYCHVCGINPPQSNQNGPSINTRNWIFIASFVLFALPSAAFLVLEAKSMFEYGISLFATSLAVFTMCVYLVIVWQTKNTWLFIENCEQFIEKRECSIIAYRELVNKIEQFCNFIAIAFIVTVLFLALPLLILSLVNYYILELGAESFILFIPVKLPFVWKTPFGYFKAWLAQFASGVAFALTGIIFLNLILGSCWLFVAMAEDITKDLVAFNVNVKANANRMEWMKRFSAIVQLYSDVKEYVNEFNAIMKYSLFLTLFLAMLCECSILLTLQFQFLDENAKLFEAFMASTLALWIFGSLFFMCEYGERMTYHFDMFGEEVERCDWHKLPIELQRMYFIFLSDTQQPKHIACYGNILCTRETFEKITNRAWSYFMSLRQFET